MLTASEAGVVIPEEAQQASCPGCKDALGDILPPRVRSRHRGWAEPKHRKGLGVSRGVMLGPLRREPAGERRALPPQSLLPPRLGTLGSAPGSPVPRACWELWPCGP